MDEIYGTGLKATELPHAEAEEAEDEELGIPEISEADLVPHDETIPYVYVEIDDESDADDEPEPEPEDLTEYVLGSFDEMKEELVTPFQRKRSIAEAIILNRPGKKLDVGFFAKNAGNFIGFLFGLAVARMLHGGLFLYFFMAVNWSFALGFLKHYFVDKYPARQTLRMDLAFTLKIIFFFALLGFLVLMPPI